MRVVFHTADRMGINFFLFADTCQESPQAGFRPGWNEFLPVFSAEDNMKQVLHVRVRHCVAPPGVHCICGGKLLPRRWRSDFIYSYPRLRCAAPWAKLRVAPPALRFASRY